MMHLEENNQFWQWFEKQAEGLLKKPSFEVIDELAEQIKKVDPGITAEVSNCHESIDRELTVTSHCDQSKFELILDFVRMAPLVSGWQFQALKPPRGFSFQVEGKSGLSIGDWRFVPLKSSPEFTEIGLRIEMTEDDLKNMNDELLHEIIEEGVGEVLLSLCSHIEYGSSMTPKAISLNSLAETLYSWALRRSPQSFHKYLQTIEIV